MPWLGREGVMGSALEDGKGLVIGIYLFQGSLTMVCYRTDQEILMLVVKLNVFVLYI